MTRSVTIVGAGPAGLSAARALHRAGLRDVLVIERNPQPGGLPRFCAHPGWGMLDLGRCWTGPRYAAALVRRAEGVEIATGTTVLGLEPGGGLRVSSPDGVRRVSSRAVLLATGVRETPRSVRLVSGTRPWGVTTTGAFQEMVVAGGMRPFRRPVIVGSELVAFSALLTARHAGICPVAMIEAGPRIIGRRPGDLVARFVFGVPVHLQTRLVAIEGVDRVEAVLVEQDGARRRLPCDGVIFTGQFVPEAALLGDGVIELDRATGGPVVDNYARCSDPNFFAAGNLLRGVEHSGAVAREGMFAAACILRALAGALPAAAPAMTVQAAGLLRWITPQRLIAPVGSDVRLVGRAAAAHHGHMRLLLDGAVIQERMVHALPERRVVVHVPSARLLDGRSLRAELV
jgi:NADPH-dependent 2,4-dienoyl-CoA reductase/sulfur reductase-like enzyme